MKKPGTFFFIGTLALLIAISSFYTGHYKNSPATISQDTIKYKDGIYEGQSRDSYTDEPYWGKAQITISNGLVTGVRFTIRDSSIHEEFNEEYKKHFEGNEVYIQQCINDSKGVINYPELLMKSRDINKVDATTGATWSYNIFKASVMEALKKAKQDVE